MPEKLEDKRLLPPSAGPSQPYSGSLAVEKSTSESSNEQVITENEDREENEGEQSREGENCEDKVSH